MFTVCVQKDTIAVAPSEFGKDPAQAISEEINARYANKILPGAGLCVTLMDVVDASEGVVLYGDGCLYYKCTFRLVMFRPFIGEALLAKVVSQTPQGITVSVGFFDDITILPNLLPEYSAYDEAKKMYYWVVPPDPLPELSPSPDELARTDEDQKLYIQKNDWLRIRVEEEFFSASKDVTYTLICSMTEPGTGVLDWWEEEEEEEAMDVE